MAEALYRKYRSRRLSDVVGQEHITKTLENALKSGRISHAYLLTGPRGVGKTSVARILAHEVNNLAYKEDAEHLDIIEIDAASNRRIDEIRDLRDKVHIAPASAKYKVYIIDEVHMLTKEAFNALLKTLEEPPQHAIFILATTEAHKLPETIISRTQRFTFRPIDTKAAVKHLKTLAKAEKISIDDDSLALIAQHASGSFRDSISMLDQLGNVGSKVTAQQVMDLLGVVPDESIERLAKSCQSGSPKQLLDELEQLRMQGYPAAQVAKQLSANLRNSAVEKGSAEDIELLKKLLDVPASHEPEQLLELVLMEYNLGKQPAHNSVAGPHTATGEQEESESKPPKPAKTKTITTQAPKTQVKNFDGSAWTEILSDVKASHNTLYSVLRMAQPEMQGKKLLLTFDFPFHKKRITESKNLSSLDSIVKKHLGSGITIECLVAEKSKSAAGEADSGSVKNISNIFGGAELLE